MVARRLNVIQSNGRGQAAAPTIYLIGRAQLQMAITSAEATRDGINKTVSTALSPFAFLLEFGVAFIFLRALFRRLFPDRRLIYARPAGLKIRVAAAIHLGCAVDIQAARDAPPPDRIRLCNKRRAALA